MNGIKGENIMQTERIDREIVRGLHILWKDLHTFHQAAQFLIIGAAGTLFLCIWNFYIAAVMGISTIIVYFLAKKWSGWQNTLLWMGFPVFVFVICTYVLVVGFSLYLDFPPNGAENYGRIRHSFFRRRFLQLLMMCRFGAVLDLGRGQGKHIFPFVIQRKIFSSMRSSHSTKRMRTQNMIVTLVCLIFRRLLLMRRLRIQGLLYSPFGSV